MCCCCLLLLLLVVVAVAVAKLLLCLLMCCVLWLVCKLVCVGTVGRGSLLLFGVCSVVCLLLFVD